MGNVGWCRALTTCGKSISLSNGRATHKDPAPGLLRLTDNQLVSEGFLHTRNNGLASSEAMEIKLLLESLSKSKEKKAKKRRGTRLISLEALVYPGTNKQTHA
jgi:hypothetical protein